MRNIVFTAFIFMLLFSLAARAQTYELPAELNYYGKVQDAEWGGENFGMADRFFPIGWSEDGKLAYLMEPADEACGCYFLELHMVDLETDSLYRLWRYSDDEDPIEGNSAARVWKEKNREIQALLRKHKIIQQKEFKLYTHPVFRHRKHIFFVELKTQRKKVDWNYFEAVTDMDLYVERAGGKKKRVFSHSEKEYAYVLNADLVGYLRFPFGNRIALLVKEEQRGWEGPPNVKSLKVIGCNMGVGFNK